MPDHLLTPPPGAIGLDKPAPLPGDNKGAGVCAPPLSGVSGGGSIRADGDGGATAAAAGPEFCPVVSGSRGSIFVLKAARLMGFLSFFFAPRRLIPCIGIRIDLRSLARLDGRQGACPLYRPAGGRVCFLKFQFLVL